MWKSHCNHSAKTNTVKEIAAWKTDKNNESRIWRYPGHTLSVSPVLGIAYTTKVTYHEVIAHLKLRTKQLGEEFFGHRRNQDE